MNIKSFLAQSSIWMLLCCSCSSTNDEAQAAQQTHQTGEYIYRKHDDLAFTPEPPVKTSPKLYPWDKEHSTKYANITKEFFRCKGSSLNPKRTTLEKGETKYYNDCGGSEKHSLPMRDGKEFVYPILLDLLNYIQTNLHKRVVITSGHRCPEHNSYVDPAPEQRSSKHMIGAEVAFYVQGMEEKPDVVIELIQEYYKNNPLYKGKKDYDQFLRYDKNDTNVSIQPWYNKEIFIKLFTKKEGRDHDNRHPYAYISIQVRHDRERNERVIYSWDKAHRGYHRW